MAQTERTGFGSKLGIILATAGSAVGLGNVWRFPYMTGDNGGAVFILIYVACVVLLGVPCMVSEFIVGRHAQANTGRAYRKMAGNGSPWGLVGFMGVVTGFLVIGYYAVVSGWCLHYMYASIAGQLHGTPEYITAYFAEFEKNPVVPVLWTVAIMLITHFIVARGVRGGIEKASKLMMPALFVLLVVIVVVVCTLPGAVNGVKFLFNPDFSKVGGDVFLSALGQAFFSLSIGMGCLCTYASYFSKDTNLPKSAVQICLIDTIVAILAGLMIFPAAFSVGISPDAGPSLVFITLPNVFHQAFSSVPFIGNVVEMLFYGLLALAALTSLISLHEVDTAFLHEDCRMTRGKASWIVTLACCVVGALCSLSLCGYDALQMLGKSLFSVFDFTTGQILLPVGGFLTCLFLGWRIPREVVREEFTNHGTLYRRLFGVYLFLVRYVCPVCIVMIFLHEFGLV